MKITQAFTFEAAHRLPKVPATHRCYNMHGHSYRIEITVEGMVDAATGFVVDFYDLESAFAPILKQLDHHCLNDIDGLENPTAENIAVWVWQRVIKSLPSLAGVKVFETPHSSAEYQG